MNLTDQLPKITRRASRQRGPVPGRTGSGAWHAQGRAVACIAWSKDGKQLAYADGADIRTFNIGPG
jgi:hypothetical protein